MMKACFMGLGYIGLPTAIIAAKHGVQVTGVDINPKVVEMTNQGKLHIIEPGMNKYRWKAIPPHPDRDLPDHYLYRHYIRQNPPEAIPIKHINLNISIRFSS